MRHLKIDAPNVYWLGYIMTFINGTKTYPKIPRQHFQEGSEIWSSAKSGLIRCKGLQRNKMQLIN